MRRSLRSLPSPSRSGLGSNELPALALAACGLLATLLPGVAQATDPPVAHDDFLYLGVTDDTVSYAAGDLVANDTYPDILAVNMQRPPLHGALTWNAGSWVYAPSDTFWAVGSDLATYRLVTSEGTAHATVHFVAQRAYSDDADVLRFEDPTDTTMLQRAGVSYQTLDPLVGSASLAVRPSEAHGDSYLSFAFETEIVPGPDGDTVKAVPTDNGNSDFCLGDSPGGNGPGFYPYGGKALGDAAGYVLLVGPSVADIDTAVVRVGLDPVVDGLFLEVREVDSQGFEQWHRTQTLLPGNDTLRVNVAFDIDETFQLAAVMRFDGLAVRSPVVTYYGPKPTTSHIGSFASETGGLPPDVQVDQISVSNGSEDPEAGPGLYGSLMMADNFEGADPGTWAGTYGVGMNHSLAAMSGDGGRSLTDYSLRAFDSYQTPVGVDAQQLSVRTRVDTSAFALEDFRRFGLLAVQSSSHPFYGDSELELRLNSYYGRIDASLRFHEGQNVWHGTAWNVLDGEHVVRVQIGRSDGPGVDNGWARLWIDGQIAQEIYHLPTDALLRTVHVGAKQFPEGAPSGSIRFDDVTVTK